MKIRQLSENEKVALARHSAIREEVVRIVVACEADESTVATYSPSEWRAVEGKLRGIAQRYHLRVDRGKSGDEILVRIVRKYRDETSKARHGALGLPPLTPPKPPKAEQ